MALKRAEAKITVAKFIELAYSKDKCITSKIMAKKGNVKLTVDQNGKATLSGSAGMLTFSGAPVLQRIGAKVKRVSVNFNNEDGMNEGRLFRNFQLRVFKAVRLWRLSVKRNDWSSQKYTID